MCENPLHEYNKKNLVLYNKFCHICENEVDPGNYHECLDCNIVFCDNDICENGCYDDTHHTRHQIKNTSDEETGVSDTIKVYNYGCGEESAIIIKGKK